MRIAKLLVSSAFAVAISTAAFSAQAQTAAPAGAFNWTGPYFGLNAGGAYNGATRFDRTTGALANNNTALQLGLRPTEQTLRSSGFIGGAQVGYNWELGDRFGIQGVVAGAEADIAYTDIHKTTTLSNTTLYGALDTPGTVPTTRVNQYQGDLNYLGTVRGRVGFAMGRALFYGTGGLAYGDVQRRITFYGPNAPTTPFFTGENSGMKTGYTYGGGVEWAVPTNSFFNVFNVVHSSGVTLKAEYLHYDLGADTLSYPGVNGGSTIGAYNSRVRTDGDLVRAGVNYKF